MTTENITLFRALGAKMDYLNTRQRVLAQNISNGDTPNYVPHDLKEYDFGRLMKNIEEKGKLSVRMETTDGLHMPPPNTAPAPREGDQKETYEVAPAGNAVVMEEQLIKAGANRMDYNLITNIYKKNMAMMKTSLGRGGQ